MLNNNTRNNNPPSPPQECPKGLKETFYVIAIIIVLSLGAAVIRYYAGVTEEQYYRPCNNKDIIPQSEITILEKEKHAYDKIINEYERSSKFTKLSTELRSIKLKKKDVEKKIQAQNCYRQACAKINIAANLEKIKNKTLTISTWLFRIGAILILLSGFLCYYERRLIGWGFGVIVFLVVGPIFINAFLSLYDYRIMSDFRMKC